MLKRVTMLFLLCVSALLWTSQGFAETYNVSVNENEEITIQKQSDSNTVAFSDLSDNLQDGDIINFAEGTFKFPQCLQITKAVIINGKDNKTILEGSDAFNHIIYVKELDIDGEITIQNLKFQNGKANIAPYTTDMEDGGALHIGIPASSKKMTVNVVSCDFSNNEAPFGSAASVNLLYRNSKNSIDEIYFKNCTFSNNGTDKSTQSTVYAHYIATTFEKR